MTDKTLQDRLRFELSRIADEECYDGGSHQLMFLRQSEARELRDALDAQAERIKALEGALRELIAAGDNSVSTDDDVAAMLRYGEADKQARALLGEK